MVSFLMIMGIVLFEHVAEGPFSKQDEPRQDFFLHGPHPALGVSIQIRTALRKGDGGEIGRASCRERV
jgi:hypothetical protein